MNAFTFARAGTTSDAISAASGVTGSRYIAGGTNLLDLMKDGVERPSLIVDINALPLRQVTISDGAMHVGALARMSDVAADPQVRAAFPVLAIALEESASPQLRNMASMGGNVLQRTRCPYFRDVATPCNKRVPGSGCGAIGGVNREQAVLGTSPHCIATHASDAAVALTALGATVHTAGTPGGRDIEIAQFYRTPGTTPQIENVLLPGELIVGISIPLQPAWPKSTYVKVRDRAQFDFALASAAVALDVGDGTIRAARVALGGVATVPWRSPEAEGALTGSPATRATFSRAADAALASARGYGENDYKIVLAKRTLVRALEIVSESA